MFSTVQKYGFIYGFIQRFMLFMAIPGTKRNHIKLLKRFSHSVSLSAIDPFGLRATKILSFFMQCNLNNITTQKHIQYRWYIKWNEIKGNKKHIYLFILDQRDP